MAGQNDLITPDAEFMTYNFRFDIAGQYDIHSNALAYVTRRLIG